MSEIMDEEVAVVDIGSSSAKVGFAGEDTPRVICPSCNLEYDDNRIRKMETLEYNEDAGPLGMGRNHAVHRGFVPNFDGAVDNYITLLEQIFERDLNVTPDTMPILLTEPPLNNQDTRETIAEHLFEALKVPALSICNTAVLCLFAAGRTRGLVVESGAGATHVVPIFEGFALNHAVLRMGVGGQDITRKLTHDLRQAGNHIEFETVRELKEKLCSISPTKLNQGRSSTKPGIAYELPDGQTINVPGHLIEAGPEILFEPGAYHHLEAPDGGVASMAAVSASMCDADIAAELLGSVVLAGGNTMIPGFAARMKADLAKAIPEGTLLHVVPDPNRHESGYNAQRRHAAWIGGSMFASLPTFQLVRVTKQEWEDNGEKSIVHRKAL